VSDPRHGYRHQQVRKALIVALRNSAEGVACVHGCGVLITPNTPSHRIDLAHVPGGADDQYSGLSHAHCNRSDGAWGERRDRFPQSNATRDPREAAAAMSYEDMEREGDLRFYGRVGAPQGAVSTCGRYEKVGHVWGPHWPAIDE
jgi:hypothetical protein